MKGTIENYKENILKEGLKRALYHSEQTRVVYDELANFRFLRQYKQYSEKLEQLHNKHKGQRCFLVATGPSINKTNLSLLDNEITVGVNTAYKLPVNYNYFVVSDRIIWDVYKDTLLSLGTTLFIGYVASRHFLSRKLRDDVYLVKGKRTTSLPQNFPSTINNHVYVYANTVVYLALQILYYLGFSEVYLLGCDCTYSVGHFDGQKFTKHGRIQTIASEEEKFWNKIFDAYKICKNVYENDNRKIYNATIGGELEVFERKKIEDVINGQN